MKKHIISTAALLSAGLMASAAQATVHDFEYEDLAPAANAAIKIELAGSCAAKIVLPITEFRYMRTYADDTVTNVVDVDSTAATMTISVDGVGAGPDFVLNAVNDVKSYGQRVNDSIVRNVRRSQANFVGNGSLTANASIINGAIMNELQNGGYDGSIRCRDGGTLADNISAAGAGVTADVLFDASGERVNGSWSHVNTTADNTVGTYVAKLTSYGNLVVPSQCALRGSLADAGNPASPYVLACAPARVIKLKVTAYAKGTSAMVTDNP
ncbi:MAG: hypothetical protein R3E63_07075 [Pseudomonadales bacterium]